MLSYGSAEYIYNAQGSLTTKISGSDTTRYTYDLMGNLLAVSLPNGDEIEYIIDPQNRRVGKILNGVVAKKWIYQDQLNPVAELDGNDSLLSRFVYGSKVHVPDYIVKSNTTYRVITDHLGSVRAVVNVSTGEVVQEISYSEFGEVFSNTNPGFQPFAYAGGLYDIHIELVRFGARDYDANVGRWTAKDPIGFGGGLNLYIYVGNNPISKIDPFGLQETYDINVETPLQAMRGSLNPAVGTMHVTGKGLQYIQDHPKTNAFVNNLLNEIALCGESSGHYSEAINYGTMGDPSKAFSTGTWLFGGVHLNADWAVDECGDAQIDFSIRDDYDVESGPDHTKFYNAVANTLAEPLWYGLLNGRRDAPIHTDWSANYTIH